MSERFSSRRRFLSVFPGAAISALVRDRESAESILDLHQHALYCGRSHKQLAEDQAVNNIAKIGLLPGDGWSLQEMGGNRVCAALFRPLQGNRVAIP
jgi:hypothetical protein